MSASFHSLGEGFLIETHTNGSHFCDCHSSLMELISPGVHFLLPLWKSLGHYLRKVVISSFWSLTDLPHEPPFGVKHRIKRGDRHVFNWKVKFAEHLGVVPRHLNIFGSSSHLVVEFCFDIIDLLTSVEELSCLLKVVLHQIDVVIIVFVIDTRVSDKEDAELVEAFSDLLALNLCLVRKRLYIFKFVVLDELEIHIDINDGNVGEI